LSTALCAFFLQSRCPTNWPTAGVEQVRIWYHMAMARTQTLIQLTDRLLAALDQYAAQVGRSRSDVIRSAIERYLDEVLQDEIDRAVVEGYRRIPQEPDAYVEAAARDSIAAEPW